MLSILYRKSASHIRKINNNNNNLINKSSSVIRTFSTGNTNEADKTSNTKKPTGLIEKYFGVDSNDAPASFKNRWLMLIPAFATHMCIGTPWAWSILADACTRELGFVTSAAADWSLMESALPLSMVFGVMGFATASVGKWQMKVGPRKAMAAASLVFGGGCVVGAAGIYFHSLPLLYAGYGFLGGVGVGLPYTPPVQTLMQWFPDKKGLASGLTIAGFGSGSLVYTPIIQNLMKYFAKMPEYLGPASDFMTQIQDGKMFAEVNGSLVEVVQAGTVELAKLPYTLPEGLYVVGSGSTGAAEALAVTGAGMFGIMLASALTMRRPHSSYVAPGMNIATPSVTPDAPSTQPDKPVPAFTIEEVMRKPQFYMLGTTFFCLATGGMGMFSVAKPMMSEVFSSALPEVVTSAFAAQYLLMLSSGNLGGRLGWAALSDAIGRRNTFYLFTLGSVPLYLFLPTMIENVVTTHSTLPLYGFCASTVLAISIMGGVYAIMPAYESDLFGNRSVGAVHGRMLMFSAAAALTGPSLLLKLRSISEHNAVTNLLEKITPEQFQHAFGAPIDQASELLAAKTLTISKLLVLAPPGTIDPTPHLYDTTMYTLSGMTAVAVIVHGLVRPPVVPTPQQIVDVTAKVNTVDDNDEKKEELVGDRLVK